MAQPFWTRGPLAALIPGLIAVALMLLWAVHNGGFDADTWYWGALVLLATLVGSGLLVSRRPSFPAPVLITLLAFAGYVAWSYASIAWAQAPGAALEGSNRALLYLLVFTLMTVLPWTPRAALAALTVFALGIGVIALVLLLRLASADQVQDLLSGGRLQAPTGYFNANAALFTIGALTSTGLASRRELPGLLRGSLIGLACACLQLAVVAQSRGWLFTFPLVLLFTALVMPDRLRVLAAAVLPALATLMPAHKLVAVFNAVSPAAQNAASRSAGGEAVVLCTVMAVLGTVLAWTEGLVPGRPLSAPARRAVGLVLTLAVLASGVVGAAIATHGDPLGFAGRQIRGFSHPPTAAARGSHFATVGSGRYDFWRVALDAFVAHPVGGLGQDNFSDYYVSRRRTKEEPLWVHSLELRLLAHTGFVGFVLFTAFLTAAGWAAVRARKRASKLGRAVAAIAVLPALVWVIHGSVDWFWEMPALSGPALGFLGLAVGLSSRGSPASPDLGRERRRTAGLRRPVRIAAAVSAVAVLLAAVVTLGFSYLSVREVSMATDAAGNDPGQALHDLTLAARFNPLSSDAGVRAGLIALSTGADVVARQRFEQSLARERENWLAWLGEGMADSGLGQPQAAERAFRAAYAINDQQPPVLAALHRVFSPHPLTYAQAVPLFVIVR